MIKEIPKSIRQIRAVVEMLGFSPAAIPLPTENKDLAQKLTDENLFVRAQNHPDGKKLKLPQIIAKPSTLTQTLKKAGYEPTVRKGITIWKPRATGS